MDRTKKLKETLYKGIKIIFDEYSWIMPIVIKDSKDVQMRLEVAKFIEKELKKILK